MPIKGVLVFFIFVRMEREHQSVEARGDVLVAIFLKFVDVLKE